MLSASSPLPARWCLPAGVWVILPTRAGLRVGRRIHRPRVFPVAVLPLVLVHLELRVTNVKSFPVRFRIFLLRLKLVNRRLNEPTKPAPSPSGPPVPVRVVLPVIPSGVPTVVRKLPYPVPSLLVLEPGRPGQRQSFESFTVPTIARKQ